MRTLPGHIGSGRARKNRAARLVVSDRKTLHRVWRECAKRAVRQKRHSRHPISVWYDTAMKNLNLPTKRRYNRVLPLFLIGINGELALHGRKAGERSKQPT